MFYLWLLKSEKYFMGILSRYKEVREMFYLCKLMVLLFMLCGFGWQSLSAQILTEQQASKETYIDGLRLLGPTRQDARLSRLGVNLGYVENGTKPGNGKYFCGGLSRDKAERAGEEISRALTRMTDASLRKLNLKYIILCSSTKAKGRRIGGIPVPPLDLLMLDVTGNRDSSKLQNTCLHELYHLAEFRFNTYRDIDWQRKFGRNYANSYSGYLTWSPIGSGKRGFLNSYSETFAHEERAVIFSYLMLDSNRVVRHIRTMNDVLLKEKVLYMADKVKRMLGIPISLPAL